MIRLRPLFRCAMASLALIASGPAWSQGAVLQGGSRTLGHVPMYVQSGSSGGQTIVQDSGGAGSATTGMGLSELLLVKRGQGSPPYVNGGTGPLGTSACLYDGPTTSAAGYHYLCMDPNAQGGALIVYGAGGTAAQLPFNININGTIIPFPGAALPSITIGATVINGGTSGYFLYANAGVVGNYNLFGTQNTWTAAQTVTAPVAASLYKIGTDTILTHPLTPNPLNTPDSIITLGAGAGSSLAPVRTTQYLTLLGVNAGHSLTTPDHITAVGAYALENFVTAAINPALGTLTSITAIGVDVMRALLSGTSNVGVGEHALASPTAASHATAVGNNAMLNIGGDYNSAFGVSAMQGSVGAFTGQNNSAMGTSALSQITGAAGGNTGTGAYACGTVTTGSNNVCLGLLSGNAVLTTGSGNILIGTNVDTPTAATNNYLNIGNIITGTSTLLSFAGPISATSAGAFNPATNTNAALQATGSFGGGFLFLDNGGYIGAWSSSSGSVFNMTTAGNAGGFVSSVGAFQISATQLKFNVATASTSAATGSGVFAGGLGVSGAIWAGTYVSTTPTTVPALGTCNAGTQGARRFVTDSNAASYTAGIGTVAATGGSTAVPVTCDGAAWRIGANDNYPLERKAA